MVAATAIVARQPMDRYQNTRGALTACGSAMPSRKVCTGGMSLPSWSVVVAERYSIEPFCPARSSEDAAMCFASITSTRQLARPPQPFDRGEEDQFIERWMGWLADAAEEQAGSPTVHAGEAG